MFKLQEMRYVIDGTKVAAKRKKKDMTLARMAFLCGWGASYQWCLENRIETVSESTKKIIENVLRS